MSYYTCFDCGGQVFAGGKGCLPCLQQKTLKKMADEQEAENRRSREREREREREAYYERMRQRDAERDADPEYQAQLAHQRELERQQEIERQRKIAEARRTEQERWNSLTPQQQAEEKELNRLRILHDSIRSDYFGLTNHTVDISPVKFGSFGSDHSAVLAETAAIQSHIDAVKAARSDWLEKKQKREAKVGLSYMTLGAIAVTLYGVSRGSTLDSLVALIYVCPFIAIAIYAIVRE